ncbi:MAG: CyaY protein [Planctomycetota bacterium]|jgi:CyaY protein
MDRIEFLSLADDCMTRVADWLEAFDPDEVDFSTTDGVVSIEFPDAKRYILNRQTAASQMWLAAGAHAWHFNWNAETETWHDDREGGELLARIAEVISTKIGRPVELG